MATVPEPEPMPTQPDEPPGIVPPSREPDLPEPPETEPPTPDFAEPGVSPDEMP